MSTFTVVPIRKGINSYNAPIFYVEASGSKDAQQEAINKSGLARFPEWSFHVIETSKDRNSHSFKNAMNKSKVINKRDPNSKSQIGKKKTGHSNSRPVRRGLRRLAWALGYNDSSMTKAGAVKMW